jgi:hypothetical protein
MIAVDGFQFQMKVLILLDCRFQVNCCNCFVIFEFTDVLQNALVTDLPDGDFDAAEVQHYLAKKSFFNNIHNLGFD